MSILILNYFTSIDIVVKIFQTLIDLLGLWLHWKNQSYYYTHRFHLLRNLIWKIFKMEISISNFKFKFQSFNSLIKFIYYFWKNLILQNFQFLLIEITQNEFSYLFRVTGNGSSYSYQYSLKIISFIFLYDWSYTILTIMAPSFFKLPFP